MRITKRRLRKLIREAVNEAKEPMTVDYVMGSLTNGKSAMTGDSFMDIALAGLHSRDYRRAANAIMDALWIDDPPPGAEEELEHILSMGVRTAEDLADVGAKWGTTHFRSH